MTVEDTHSPDSEKSKHTNPILALRSWAKKGSFRVVFVHPTDSRGNESQLLHHKGTKKSCHTSLTSLIESHKLR